MTVNNINITAGPYTGNGLLDTYDFDFKIDDKSEIEVYETDDSGVQTLLTVDTNYTVAGIGDENTGKVTRVAGVLPTDYIWFMRSNLDETQETGFDSQGGFFPDVHEDAFDKITLLFQQWLDIVNRAARIADGDSSGAVMTLPVVADATDRANQFLQFDANGDLAVGTVLSDIGAFVASALNISNALVQRDGSGNFAASVITAALVGAVTGDLTGNVTGDVTGNSEGTHTGPVVGNALLGDGTAALSLRRLNVLIEDGTNANTLKVTVGNSFQGEVIAVTDNVAKNATTGDFTLASTGYFLDFPISQTSNAMLSFGIYLNTTATDLYPDVVFSGGLMRISFTALGSSTPVDITSVIDGGLGVINTSSEYLTTG